jgi:peroxiredoxin
LSIIKNHLTIKIKLKMKRILLVVSTILLATCNAIGGDEYEIKGKIINPTVKTVYLEKLSHTEMKLVDSAEIKNGQFTMKGIIDAVGLYRLKIKAPAHQNELFWLMTLEKNEKVTISLDPTNYEQSSITGNANQQEMQDLIKNMNKMQNELGQLYQQYQAASKTNPESKEATELSAQLQTKSDNLNKYVTSVIQSSKGILTKYYLYSILLQQFQNQPIPDQLAVDIKAYTEQINKALPKSPYARDFNTIVTNLDAQKKMAATQSMPSAPSKLDVGAPAPDVDLMKEDGSKVKLSSFKGKVVLMDFWASWCRPCRMENPNVVAAYNKYKSKGFVIVSISQDQDLAKWNAAVQQDGLVWPTHFADKLAGNQASSMYEVSYIPKTYLIDKNGKIAAKDLRGPALEVELEKLLNTKK